MRTNELLRLIHVERSDYLGVTTYQFRGWDWLLLQTGAYGLSFTFGALTFSFYWAERWKGWGVSKYTIPDARLLRFDVITPIFAIFYLGWFPFPKRRA